MFQSFPLSFSSNSHSSSKPYLLYEASPESTFPQYYSLTPSFIFCGSCLSISILWKNIGYWCASVLSLLLSFPYNASMEPVAYRCSAPIHMCAQSLSHIQLFATPWAATARIFCPCNFPGKKTRVGYHFLLPRIFLTWGSTSLMSPALAGRFFTIELLYI